MSSDKTQFHNSPIQIQMQLLNQSTECNILGQCNNQPNSVHQFKQENLKNQNTFQNSMQEENIKNSNKLDQQQVTDNQVLFQPDQIDRYLEPKKESILQNQNIRKISKRQSFGKRKKNRKIRTTITKEKLIQMNRIFTDYMRNKDEGKNPKFNLKQIGHQLQLGYSTILHKFRQFRSNKKVKGGALIASLQKKRKYKKSVEIQQIIQETLNQKPFFTAVELSKYIFNKYGKNFSRSIISRHLGEMGYSYKNLKTTPIQKNKLKYKEIRKIYSTCILPLFNAGVLFVYIDELACSLTNFIKKKGGSGEIKKAECLNDEQEYISVLISASSDGILYYKVKYGFFTRDDFCESLIQSVESIQHSKNKQYIGPYNRYHFVTDLNKIHRDIDDDDRKIGILINQLQIRRFYLPPSSPQLNPIQSIFANLKNKIIKKDMKDLSQLKNQIQMHMIQIKQEQTEVYFKDLDIWLDKSIKEDNF